MLLAERYHRRYVCRSNYTLGIFGRPNKNLILSTQVRYCKKQRRINEGLVVAIPLLDLLLGPQHPVRCIRLADIAPVSDPSFQRGTGSSKAASVFDDDEMHRTEAVRDLCSPFAAGNCKFSTMRPETSSSFRTGAKSANLVAKIRDVNRRVSIVFLITLLSPVRIHSISFAFHAPKTSSVPDLRDDGHL